MRQILLCCALLLMNTIVHAEIFKCKNASGAITYSEQPCAAGTSNGNLVVKSAPSEADTAATKETTSRLSRSADVLGLEAQIRTYQADKERAVTALQARLLTIRSSNPKVTVVNSTVEAHNANTYQQIDATTKSYDDKIADATAKLEKLKSAK